MFLIFKKQAVIFEAVRINFKCNGFVCVLSFFFRSSRFPDSLYCSVHLAGRLRFCYSGWLSGGIFSQRFCWGLEVRGEPWNLFSYFGPKSMIVHTLFQTWTKGKNDFRHMRDLRLVHGSYKRPQLTRIDFLLHSTVRRTTNLSILMQEKKKLVPCKQKRHILSQKIYTLFRLKPLKNHARETMPFGAAHIFPK